MNPPGYDLNTHNLSATEAQALLTLRWSFDWATVWHSECRGLFHRDSTQKFHNKNPLVIQRTESFLVTKALTSKGWQLIVEMMLNLFSECWNFYRNLSPLSLCVCQHLMCAGLWCLVEGDASCKTKLDPPLDGTECGADKVELPYWHIVQSSCSFRQTENTMSAECIKKWFLSFVCVCVCLSGAGQASVSVRLPSLST